ncbi:MAG TPA: DHA2 family efflux MFS transporter permease subunit [Chloroflexota bacterium]|nr:DHA2 family efflux MFS transporter permease subunit [Chloroflexota bacterium]
MTEFADTTRRWWTFALVCVALFMTMLDNLVVITALPSIGRALGAGLADLEWTVNAYTLAFAVLMMTGAALGDRFGRRRVFLIGVAIFTAASAGSALAGSALQLALSRASQGLGAALVTPLTLTMLSRVFPPERRAVVIGLWSGVSGLGLAIGPLVGGLVVEGLHWNAIFWINVPVGIALLALGAWRLDESYGDRLPLDLPGLGFAGFGLLGIVYGLIRGNALGWSSAQIVASLAGGAVLLALFVRRELRTSAPMLDLSLFRVRDFSASIAVSFLMSAGMFGSIFLITLFIQNVRGASPLTAGLETMPWTGTIMLVAPIAGQLASRFGSRPLILAGLALQAAALLWFGTAADPSTPYLNLLPAFIGGGLGMGLTFAPMTALVMGSVSLARHGQASGASNALRELGGVFGIAILGAVFQHLLTSPGQVLAALHTSLTAGAAIILAAMVAAVLIHQGGGSAAAALPAEAALAA